MKSDRSIYTSHIKDPNKQLEMRKILDKIDIVTGNHTIETTDFLDPYERNLAKSILNRFEDIRFIEFGGTINSERKIIAIFPDYYEDYQVELKLSYLRISGDILGLTHKDYLGALLSLGIKRTKTGDILVHNDHADLIVKEETGSFIFLNLDKISNKKVLISEIKREDLEEPVNNFREISKFIPSLRLDAVISSAYNLSRQESINIIKFGNVKVNWEHINKPSKELNEGDTISTKGFGRAILYSIDGISKKGRLHVIVRILV